MKHKVFLFAVMMIVVAVPLNAQNYLFTDTLADGQVLYFDTLDSKGIFVEKTGSYSHTLHSIRRVYNH